MGFLSALFGQPQRYNIDEIEIGFSKEQVLAAFGEPKSITKGSWKNEEWVYTIPWRVYVSIDFDKNGKVARTWRSGENPWHRNRGAAA